MLQLGVQITLQGESLLFLWELMGWFDITQNRRRLVGGLDRSGRDVPRRGEAREWPG